MNYLTVTLDFALWWYSGGLKKLYLWLAALLGWLNNFFSIKRVFRTMFRPWKRLVEAKRPGLDGLRDWLIDNLVSRFVGLLMRIFIILGYLMIMFAFFVFALLAFIFWVFWPVFLIGSLIMVFI
jgi:hypothetical protein